MAELESGWEWLDEARGIAIPADPDLTDGVSTIRTHWRAAQPGPGRDYAVHLPTGSIAARVQTAAGPRHLVHRVTEGWVHDYGDLVHQGSGAVLHGQAEIGSVGEPRLADVRQRARSSQPAVRDQARQLNRAELQQWLHEHGWQAGTAQGAQPPGVRLTDGSAATVQPPRAITYNVSPSVPSVVSPVPGRAGGAVLGLDTQRVAEAVTSLVDAYLAEYPVSADQETRLQLSAVLAEAAGQVSGPVVSRPAWYQMVDLGLTMLPLTRSELGYTAALPGVEPASLTTGESFAINAPALARVSAQSVPGYLFEIERPEAHDIARLAGDDSGRIMFGSGTWFLVERRSDADGRGIIHLSHREEPSSLPDEPPSPPDEAPPSDDAHDGPGGEVASPPTTSSGETSEEGEVEERKVEEEKVSEGLSEEARRFAAGNPWWFPGDDPRSHGRTRDREYAPTQEQQAWLNGAWLQVAWASADGDCSFHAAVATAGQAAVRAAILRAARNAGLPVPAGADSVATLLNQAIAAAREAPLDGRARRRVAELPAVRPGGEVTGQQLRLFLAYIAERNPYSWDPEGIFDHSESPGEGSTTWPGLVEALRKLGNFAEPYGDYFAALIRYVLTVPVAVLMGNGMLSTRAEPFNRSEYLPDVPDIEQPYIIVLRGEHYSGTVRRRAPDSDNVSVGLDPDPDPDHSPRPDDGPAEPETDLTRKERSPTRRVRWPAAPPVSQPATPGQLTFDEFANLPANAVAVNAQGVYMTVSGGLGAVEWMGDAKFFAADGEELGYLQVSQIRSSAEEVSFGVIGKHVDLPRVSGLLLWYMVAYSGARQFAVYDIVSEQLPRILGRFGMSSAHPTGLDMRGDAEVVGRNAAAAAVADGWLLRILRPETPVGQAESVTPALAAGPDTAFEGLPPEAVAVHVDGSYLTVPSGIGVVGGMRDPRLFGPDGRLNRRLGLTGLDELSLAEIIGNIDLSCLALWYLAAHTTAPRLTLTDVVGDRFIRTLAGIGMTRSGNKEMTGDALRVARYAAAAAARAGWTLRSLDRENTRPSSRRRWMATRCSVQH